MRNHSQIVAGIALAGLLAWPESGGAAPPGQNVIRAVDVADRDGSVEVEIRATRAPSYTVFKLQDPPRLVVDVAGGDVSGVASPVRVDRGGVASVSTAQYQDEKTSVGRVVIALDAAARYEVSPQGDAVRVKILSGAATREAAPAQAPVVSPEPATVAVSPELPAAPAAGGASGRPRGGPACRRVQLDEGRHRHHRRARAGRCGRRPDERPGGHLRGHRAPRPAPPRHRPPRGTGRTPPCRPGRRWLHPGSIRPRRRQGARGARRVGRPPRRPGEPHRPGTFHSLRQHRRDGRHCRTGAGSHPGDQGDPVGQHGPHRGGRQGRALGLASRRPHARPDPRRRAVAEAAWNVRWIRVASLARFSWSLPSTSPPAGFAWWPRSAATRRNR